LPTKELLHRTANTEEDAVCRIRSEERERKREDNTKFEKRKREEKEQAGMERMRSSSLESFSPDETFTNTSNETIRSVTRKFTQRLEEGREEEDPPKTTLDLSASTAQRIVMISPKGTKESARSAI
jgi:hypothetical protein